MKREINMCRFGKEKERKDFKDAKAARESREDNIITDPNGSYTGVNIYDKLEKPIQDVDDL